MKFVVAVVMLALAIGVQSSYLPYAAHYSPAVSYVSHAVHAAPYAYAHGPAAVAVHAAPYWGHSGPSHWGGYPGISLSQGPHGHGLGYAAPLAHAAHGHGHDGVYVAKTRGAIHTAPLIGHTASATSLNIAPAPGTH